MHYGKTKEVMFEFEHILDVYSHSRGNLVKNLELENLQLVIKKDESKTVLIKPELPGRRAHRCVHGRGRTPIRAQ